MPVADQIRDLTARILADFEAASDYYEHTKAVWRLAQQITRLGHAYEIEVPESGRTLTLADLAGHSQDYVASYLAESIFQHYVALFEDFVFELLRIWLTAHPAGIPNKDRKPVDLATVIDAADKEAILGFVIDRELNALKYERPVAWFRYLNDRVKLGCPTDEQIERFAEIKASRDLLSHNRGVVNETYLQKAGARARYQLGQRLEIPEPYLRETWTAIGAMVQDMTAAASARS